MSDKVEITKCARCGENHEVEVRKFMNPLETRNGVIKFHYWTMCPVRDEPILIQLRQG